MSYITIAIWRETKEKFDKFAEVFPDIEKIKFCSEAIETAIKREKERRIQLAEAQKLIAGPPVSLEEMVNPNKE